MKLHSLVVWTAPLMIVLSGCGTTDTTTLQTTDTTVLTTLNTTYIPDSGRLLASQCFQCHGTNGISVTSWDSIAGEDNLHDEMFEDDAPIMYAQALGYTSSEITLMETWLNTQSTSSSDYESDTESDENDDED